MYNMYSVLIINPEDKDAILAESLVQAGFEVKDVADPGVFLKTGRINPDVLIVRVDESSEESGLLSSLTRNFAAVPIIALTRESDPRLRSRHVQQGADFCLTTPVSLRELIARIEALIWRHQKTLAVLNN
jgi:two-component system, OmpR family, response regulator MprA